MRVTIYGAGYVGLVTGACFAEMGNHVLCMDVDERRVAALRRGECPIHEPGLTELLVRNLQAGRLAFTTDQRTAVEHATVQMIAVGTPPDEDGAADLKHVLAVARGIAEHMSDYLVIVSKSTVPVGTGDKIRAAMEDVLARKGAAVDFDVVSNPEFLKEGAAVGDFMKPDRIVVGTESATAIELMQELYAPFGRNHNKLMIMDRRSAELTKYAANVMLATKISLMNEFANLAEALGADVEQVRRGIGSDPRIGFDFIYPGCGYGGSCFPKDVQALNTTAREVNFPARIVSAVQEVNTLQKRTLFEKAERHFGNLAGRTFAVWGLAFKPNTDDMREAPSVTLVEALAEAGADVRGYDPVAGSEAKRRFEALPFTLAEDRDATLENADALFVCTEWNEFRSPDFDLVYRLLKSPVIFDGRNLYDPAGLKELGFTYYGVGRGASLNSRV